MDSSLFIVRILGPYFLIVALGMLLNRGFFQKMMEDFCKNNALLFLSGLFALIFGIVIVMLHNLWVSDWRVIITIFGWGGLIKGIWLIVFPNTVPKFMQVYSRNKSLLVVHSLVALVLGVCLTFLGYFAA